ncbi:hypothetical protein NM688_g3701 [Phlebia brevispora]|uniref:Uncharacterized protein n=1 Tax=Phlebia brevispora TaxID=194682 RepID=A0ACC1T5P7_9APHY|nr:hypothetical protein NM688_g3701 [Phlebia brevispora]
MTDEVTPQTQASAPKKDEKKPAANGSAQAQGGGRNSRRNISRSGSVGATNKDGPSRPSSGASNKRNQSKSRAANDNTSAEVKKADDAKKADQKGAKSQGNGNPRHRKGSSAARQSAHTSRDLSRQNSTKQSSSSPCACRSCPRHCQRRQRRALLSTESHRGPQDILSFCPVC